MSPPLVIALGVLFGICSVAILYIYAKSTASFRASHKTIGRIMTPIAVFGPQILLIMSFGHLVAAFGGASHAVASTGMLLFAIVWFCGCLYVGLKFGPKKR